MQPRNQNIVEPSHRHEHAHRQHRAGNGIAQRGDACGHGGKAALSARLAKASKSATAATASAASSEAAKECQACSHKEVLKPSCQVIVSPPQ